MCYEFVASEIQCELHLKPQQCCPCVPSINSGCYWNMTRSFSTLQLQKIYISTTLTATIMCCAGQSACLSAASSSAVDSINTSVIINNIKTSEAIKKNKPMSAFKCRLQQHSYCTVHRCWHLAGMSAGMSSFLSMTIIKIHDNGMSFTLTANAIWQETGICWWEKNNAVVFIFTHCPPLCSSAVCVQCVPHCMSLFYNRRPRNGMKGCKLSSTQTDTCIAQTTSESTCVFLWNG